MITTASLGRTDYGQDLKTAPQMRAAGVNTKDGMSARECLKWPQERPDTPEELRKFRQSTLHTPGIINRHFGMADDPVPKGTFGVKSKSQPGESVAENVFSFPDTEMGLWQREQQEAIYASTKREPLGGAYVRGHQIPDQMGTTRPFGVIIGAKELEREGQARKCMFPTEGDPDSVNDGSALYAKSHGACAPGEQRRRDYDWSSPGVDPNKHRFGFVEKDAYRDGVSKALHPTLDETAPQPARVVNKAVEDHKLTGDFLARPRKLGLGEHPELPPDHAYGAASLRMGIREPGVGELMHSQYPAEQQQPDADLGKSLREGYRNIAPEDNRSFGVPTIRTDLPLPKARSVANSINYGNDPAAHHLLRPTFSATRGVGEEQYLVLRPRDDVRSLALGEAGLSMTDADFETVFAAAAGGPGRDACTLDAFFKARHQLLARHALPM